MLELQRGLTLNTFIFMLTSTTNVSHSFTVEFRNELPRQLELNLPPPVKSVTHLPNLSIYLHSYSNQCDAKSFGDSKYL